MLRPGRLVRLAVMLACLVAGVTLGAALRVPAAWGSDADHVSAADRATGATVDVSAGTIPPRLTSAPAGAVGGADAPGRRVPAGPLDGPAALGVAAVAACTLVVAVLAGPWPRRSLRWTGPCAAPRGPPPRLRS
jgi:hypothetical protein